MIHTLPASHALDINIQRNIPGAKRPDSFVLAALQRILQEQFYIQHESGCCITPPSDGRVNYEKDWIVDLFIYHHSWNIHVGLGYECKVNFGLLGQLHRLLQLCLQLVNYSTNCGGEGRWEFSVEDNSNKLFKESTESVDERRTEDEECAPVRNLKGKGEHVPSFLDDFSAWKLEKSRNSLPCRS